MARIAYLILAHKSLDILYLQIDLLATEGTKFYIHLDKKNNIKPANAYYRREDVIFIRKQYNIYWGGFNMVRATVDLMRYAANEKFDYYILLSGQCLPVKKRTALNDFLEQNTGKSYLQYVQLPSKDLKDGGLDKVNNFYLFDSLRIFPDNYKKLLFRYLNRFLKLSGFRRKLPGNLVPFFGSQWWALSHRTVDYFLKYSELHPEIFNFFRYSWAPDELVIQTILGNSELKDSIMNKPFRYIDWTKTDINGSPKTLTIDDYEKLINCEDFFARKFDPVISSALIGSLRESVL